MPLLRSLKFYWFWILQRCRAYGAGEGRAVSPLTAAACQRTRSGSPRRRARSDAPYRFRLCQFLGNMLVEDFLHGQGDDDFVAALEERFDLLQGVRGIIERHEEAFLAILAHHHGFKGVYVRAADFVFLF